MESAKVHIKIRPSDGSKLESKGEVDGNVSFAMYMLFCGWGGGSSMKEDATTTDLAFEEAAKTFLAAAELYHEKMRLKDEPTPEPPEPAAKIRVGPIAPPRGIQRKKNRAAQR